MNVCVITFRSVTPAQRGEQILKKAGMACSLQRTPRWMEEKGCGYSLHLRCRDVLLAADLLRENNVPFRKVYYRRENGKLEEMEP